MTVKSMDSISSFQKWSNRKELKNVGDLTKNGSVLGGLDRYYVYHTCSGSKKYLLRRIWLQFYMTPLTPTHSGLISVWRKGMPHESIISMFFNSHHYYQNQNNYPNFKAQFPDHQFTWFQKSLQLKKTLSNSRFLEKHLIERKSQGCSLSVTCNYAERGECNL